MSRQLEKFIKFLITIFAFDIIMTIIYLVIAYDTTQWDGIDDHDDNGIINKFINRFYYSVNVSTSFGLGPISPISNLLKLITIMQIYLTLGLFLSKYNPLKL